MSLKEKIKTSSLIIGVTIVLVVISFFFSFYSMYNNAMFAKPFIKEFKADIYALKSRIQPKGQIVFYGDSITEMFPIDEMFPNATIINRGIGGNTTIEMEERLNSNLIELKPSKIRFLGGANDLVHNRNPKEIAETIEKILTKIQQELPDTIIYVESVYPFNPDYKGQYGINFVNVRQNKDVLELNSYIKEICFRLNIVYINTHDLLIDENNNLKDELTLDGLHINNNGYKIVSSELEKYLFNSLT